MGSLLLVIRGSNFCKPPPLYLRSPPLQFAREDPALASSLSSSSSSDAHDLSAADVPPGLSDLTGQWHGMFEATGGGNGDTSAQFDLRGSKWQSGAYCFQELQATGSYSNRLGLILERLFIQKDDAATLHADGTVFGPDPANLHFALLNFPADLLPALLQVQAQASGGGSGSTVGGGQQSTGAQGVAGAAAVAAAAAGGSSGGAPLPSPAAAAVPSVAPSKRGGLPGSQLAVRGGAEVAAAAAAGVSGGGPFGGGGGGAGGTLPFLRGVLHLEGDFVGSFAQPQCDVKVSCGQADIPSSKEVRGLICMIAVALTRWVRAKDTFKVPEVCGGVGEGHANDAGVLTAHCQSECWSSHLRVFCCHLHASSPLHHPISFSSPPPPPCRCVCSMAPSEASLSDVRSSPPHSLLPRACDSLP